MRRKPDKVVVEVSGCVFDRFESLEIVNDILGVTEARFTVGDDGSWARLERLVAPGRIFTVKLNDKLRMKGRAEVNNIPGNPASGVVFDLMIRSKLSDARYASADPGITVTNTSIKQFVIRCYAPLGYAAADFKTSDELDDVELMTGKFRSRAGTKDVEAITPHQAMIQPPETICEAVERHLKRYRLLHWDAPNGQIIVGQPDENARPLYRLLAKTGRMGKANNIVSFERIKDWTNVARTVRVHGHTFGKDIVSSPFKGEATDADVDEVARRTGHFNRLVLIQDMQSKDQAAAQRAADRELQARRRFKDALEITTDGWSFWNGTEQIPWAPNTTVDVDIDATGGPFGKYLITRTELRLTIDEGATTKLRLCRPKDWAF